MVPSLVSKAVRAAPTVSAAMMGKSSGGLTAADIAQLVLLPRGGNLDEVAAFDMALAKTRLEGLGYSTVAALLMNAALRLFSSTPSNPLPAPPAEAGAERARAVRFNNRLRIAFALCISLCVSLGSYSTIVYALMTIYCKTALGKGLVAEYVNFFEGTHRFRTAGFFSFVGTVFMFKLSWVLSLLLNHEEDEAGVRWWIILPAVVVMLVGAVHNAEIMSLARGLIFQVH
mmetsp:Transcript_6362/g.14673  ORF Transcript_6362/g.14673 Transcript_6362/m.14673 type:complete len:229 (-) Transcript_6362:258-944(-)